MDLFFYNYGSKLSNFGQHFGPSVGCYCFTQCLSVIRIQSVTVFSNFTYLWHGFSEGQRSRSSKNEGQCHVKLRKKAFLLNFRGKIFDPWCLFGVMSQSKGQRSRSLEGQI